MARRELRCIGLGDDTFWHTGCAERCPVDLFRRRDPCECLCRPLVCRFKIETAGGVFRVREDEVQPVGATLDRTSRVVMIDTCLHAPTRPAVGTKPKLAL